MTRVIIWLQKGIPDTDIDLTIISCPKRTMAIKARINKIAKSALGGALIPIWFTRKLSVVLVIATLYINKMG